MGSGGEDLRRGWRFPVMIRPAYPEIGLPEGRERERLMALRSLDHCGVIMVPMEAVPLGYRILQAAGAVRATKGPIEGSALCRLTDDGRALAAIDLK